MLVELVTDEGLTGIGEAPVVWAGSAAVTRAMIEAVAPLVVGADPLDHDLIRRRLYAETGMAHLGTQGMSWALSGIDTALWDLVGRIAGQPLHRLWGGAWRDALRVPRRPRARRAGARWPRTRWPASREGFRTLYLKVGFAPDIDEARVRAVREAVGDGPRIRIDANGAWSPGLAKRLLDRLAAYGLEYAEQPIPPGDPGRARAAARARRRCRSWRTSRACRSRARWPSSATARADAVQLDPRFDAGIAGARTAAQIAEVGGPAGAHPHVRRARRRHGADAPVARRAPQLRARQPDLLPEPDRRRHRWAARCEFDGRFLDGAHGPGLGVELDRERVAHYAAYYASEVAGRAPPEPGDPYYDRDYLIRPHI